MITTKKNLINFLKKMKQLTLLVFIIYFIINMVILNFNFISNSS